MKNSSSPRSLLSLPTSTVFCRLLAYFQQNEPSRRRARRLHRRAFCLYDRSDSHHRVQEPSFVSRKRNSPWLFVHLLPPGSEPASTHNYVLPAEHAWQPGPLCAFGLFVATGQQSIPDVQARTAVCGTNVFECGVDSIRIAVFRKSACRRY